MYIYSFTLFSLFAISHFDTIQPNYFLPGSDGWIRVWDLANIYAAQATEADDLDWYVSRANTYNYCYYGYIG